jgi:PTS system cellobiose-specific IIC component
MFDKISDTLQKYLMPIANKISSNNILQSIKDAFLISLPFTMLGSIFLALVNLPFLNDLIGADAGS